MDTNTEDNEIMFIYEWVDSVSLSRPKKNIARDFSDGVLCAEIIKSCAPKLVEIHNYPTAHSTHQKKANWTTLNVKVFKKLGFQLSKVEIEDILSYKPMAVENLLKIIHNKLQNVENNNNLEFAQTKQIDKKEILVDSSLPKEYFYQQQIEERDTIIDELNIVLQLTENKLKIAQDTKSKLENEIKEYKEKMKKVGLI